PVRLSCRSPSLLPSAHGPPVYSCYVAELRRVSDGATWPPASLRTTRKQWLVCSRLRLRPAQKCDSDWLIKPKETRLTNGSGPVSLLAIASPFRPKLRKSAKDRPQPATSRSRKFHVREPSYLLCQVLRAQERHGHTPLARGRP